MDSDAKEGESMSGDAAMLDHLTAMLDHLTTMLDHLTAMLGFSGRCKIIIVA